VTAVSRRARGVSKGVHYIAFLAGCHCKSEIQLCRIHLQPFCYKIFVIVLQTVCYLDYKTFVTLLQTVCYLCYKTFVTFVTNGLLSLLQNICYLDYKCFVIMLQTVCYLDYKTFVTFVTKHLLP
jgi:hypothetical protein